MNLRTLFFSVCMTALPVMMLGQEQMVISSPYLQANDTILIFTPDGYRSDIAYPTLYLLHGWSGDYSNWSTRVPLQETSNRYGFIIVCPDGFYNSWYVDSHEPDGMQWRQFFDHELYPAIQARYRTAPDACFITGLSMGGHGALNVFMDDPGRFRGAGSMSGVMDLRSTSLSHSEVAKVLGPFDPENRRFEEESVLHRLEKLQGTEKFLVISCGYDDVLSGHSEEVAYRCKELKIPHALLLTPGNHSWTYWDFALDVHLTFFSKILKGENLGY